MAGKQRSFVSLSARSVIPVLFLYTTDLASTGQICGFHCLQLERGWMVTRFREGSCLSLKGMEMESSGRTTLVLLKVRKE